MTHVEARRVLLRAGVLLFGVVLPWRALQFAQSVALSEGGRYGAGCYVDQMHSTRDCETNNWGAVQCPVPPPCPSGCIEATDTHRDGTPYQACFRKEPSPEAGASTFLRELFLRRPAVRAYAERGYFRQAVFEMSRTHYFEASPDLYDQSVSRNADFVARELGEPRGSVRPSWAPLAIVSTAIGLGAVALNVWRTHAARS